MPHIQEAKCLDLHIKFCLPHIGASRERQNKIFAASRIFGPPQICFCIRPWLYLVIEEIDMSLSNFCAVYEANLKLRWKLNTTEAVWENTYHQIQHSTFFNLLLFETVTCSIHNGTIVLSFPDSWWEQYHIFWLKINFQIKNKVPLGIGSP